MTDPTGRYFISYRRSPARSNGDQEAMLVRNALRDRGVPTWRDLDDLGPDPTEDELTATLRDKGLAGAVMLISPEIAESDMVRYVEAREIFKRQAANDGFVVRPVLIGLDYADAETILDSPGALQDIGLFNLMKLNSGSINETAACQIANDVVKARLRLISAAHPDAPYQVGLFSRRSPSSDGFALSYDYTPYFDARRAPMEAYALIQKALYDSASRLAATASDIKLIAQGNASLPLGVLFGAVHSRFVFDLTWMQHLRGSSPEPWSLSSGRSDISIVQTTTKGQPSSEDLVLAVSVSADVQTAVAEYIRHAHLAPRATLSVGLESGSPGAGVPLSAADGLSIAQTSINGVRALKDELGLKRANLHIFLSGPLGLAVLVGQNLNTFSECHLYEHVADATPSYEHVHSFRPSDFTYKV